MAEKVVVLSPDCTIVPDGLDDITAAAIATPGKNRDAMENVFKEQFAGGVDIVLDYLWGQSAECLLIAGSRAGTDKTIRFIQIGTASGANISLERYCVQPR